MESKHSKFERVILCLNIVLAATGIIGLFFSLQSVKILKSEFELNKRPYIGIEDIQWLGEPYHILRLNLKNYSSNPATANLSFAIKDQKTVLKELNYKEEIVLFPNETNKWFDVGYNKLSQLSIDENTNIKTAKKPAKVVGTLRMVPKELIQGPQKKIYFVFSPKDLRDINRKLWDGEKLTIELKLNYKPLVKTKIKNLDFEYLHTANIELIEGKTVVTNLVRSGD